ncbi:LysR family transcriptional regulator [uncultured Endozoicomonas sp.]|uniref:LysR family transcriptional regulator n=1 Tax=uncultured Endozoicomonas sp. TaxID=432652 RepID=UPI00260D4F12|nr:LysR family transcriptional regulator [uncultured Endozoicomonas sp.]
MNLYRLNLNLLPGLKALLDTQSVSLAAKQMHVTQSAMSRTLAQLREALHDPILVRQGNKVFLSEKALALKEDVNRVVTEAGTIFENQQFDPWTTEKNFTIAGSYILLEQYLPDILHQFWKQAPNFNFELLDFSPQLDQKLEAGQVDLVMAYVGKPPAGFSYVPLMEDTLCALISEDHPIGDNNITVEDLEKYAVVRHSSWLGSPHFMRDYLDGLSRNIRVAAKAPSFPVALQLVNDSNRILLTMEKVAEANTYVKNMRMKPLPGKLPKVQYYIVWPEYWEHNRAHRWFREFIINRFRQQLKENDRRNEVLSEVISR